MIILRLLLLLTNLHLKLLSTQGTGADKLLSTQRVKRGDTALLNNYRPISLLPTISKVFERVIYSQLYAYFNDNNLMSEQQYGFRAQHSTELASVKLVDHIIKQMDNRYETKTPVAIFCDLSKAFDCLNFDIFLSKLEYYGVDGTPLALIKSYLSNRYQYVQFENCKSDLLEVKTGIPQGSILGSLFFSVLINDIVKSSSKLSFLMYADDTTIYFNLEDFPALNREQEINKELEKLNLWFKLNKLTLNPCPPHHLLLFCSCEPTIWRNFLRIIDIYKN